MNVSKFKDLTNSTKKLNYIRLFAALVTACLILFGVFQLEPLITALATEKYGSTAGSYAFIAALVPTFFLGKPIIDGMMLLTTKIACYLVPEFKRALLAQGILDAAAILKIESQTLVGLVNWTFTIPLSELVTPKKQGEAILLAALTGDPKALKAWPELLELAKNISTPAAV